MSLSDRIRATLDRARVPFLELWFTDLLGIVKTVTLPVRELDGVLAHGHHIDGSALEGSARVAESDMVLIPDLDTFAILPWDHGEERAARLICNVHTTQGTPFKGDPRNALLDVLKQAHELGYTFKTGLELEFFLFAVDAHGRPNLSLPSDESGYFDITSEGSRIIRRRMIQALEQINLRVDSAHSEIGFGQHEIDFDYAPAMQSADQIVTAKVGLRAIAQQHNLHCTFMPRPRADLAGSGMHTHQSLHALEGDYNVFSDAEDQYGLSATARHFLAGQLQHARAMCAVLAPLVNSYKRLGTSFEAPIHITWAHTNRAALIRVPSVPKGREQHTRLELRCPDPASNPYLAAAVMLAAGLDGIRRQLPLPEPFEEALFAQGHNRARQRPNALSMLPASLGEALDAFEESDVIQASLGDYISGRYVLAKRAEFDEYNRHVTAWEVERYLARY
jgi:glutamine synthetase